MSSVHQLVHTLSYGDAISGEVLALKRIFREKGFESEVYSINTHPKYKHETLHYESFPENFSGKVVLHYSLGSPLNSLYRKLTQAKKFLIYHNLTPSKWFKSVNGRVFADIEDGVKELPELLKMTDTIVCDSHFNAQEISTMGFGSKVLPLTVDPKKWEVRANPGIAELLRSDAKIHLLHVGRLAPNKCIEDIIKAFYFLHHHVERASKLWLIGIDHDTELYSFGLKRLVRELHLEEAVQFVGRLSDEEVRSFYENSSAFISMSEHEGFCVPLIEAMHFKCPVIAYDGSAISETLADGGILVKNKNPALLAELMFEVSRNTSLRDSLVERGLKRVSQFSFESFSTQVSSIFG